MRNRKIKNLLLGCIAILSMISLVMPLSHNGVDAITKNLGFQGAYHSLYGLFVDIKMSVDGYSVLAFLGVIALFCFYKKVFSQKRDRRLKVCIMVPALLFAFFMVFGYSFRETASWDLVFGGYRTFAKAMLSYAGYSVLFYACIAYLFALLERYSIVKQSNGKERSWFTANRKSIIIVAGLILLMWLPYILANFPGITNYDFFDMLDSYYGHETYSLRAVTLLSPDVTLNNNNPVLQTLIAVLCNEIGQFIGIPVVGLMLFGYTQAILFALVLAYVIYYFAKLQIDVRVRVALLLLFGLLPIHANYAIATLKDTNFSFVFILYMLCIFDMVRTKGMFFQSKKKLWYFSGLNLLLILLRNNGLYVLALTTIILLIVFRERWKKIIIPLLAPLLLYQFVIAGFLFPLFKIAPGSRREALSIPFQQTARLIKEHGDEIPQEDKEIIDKVLDYDSLADRYTPELSDKVKATFKKDCTQAELMDYFGVWMKWLPIHLDTYMEATMSNCYGYFYPEAQSWITYDGITPPGERYGMKSPMRLQTLRKEANQLVYVIRQIPFIGMLESIGFYTWGLIMAVAYFIAKRKYLYLLCAAPLLILLLSCIAGPANTMMRYIYPLILCTPLVIIIGLYSRNEERI